MLHRPAFAAAALVLAPLLLTSPGGAEEPAPGLDDAGLDAAGLSVGTITVEAADVFGDDEAEERLVFRLADRLHRTTREGVLLRQLVLRPGDPYTGARRRECERILRGNTYLYDAALVPVRVHDGVVDLVLRTRDVWTTKVGFGFGRAGGVNRTHLGVEDGNFLGTGKQVALRRTSGPDRTEQTVRYRDPAVLGSRVKAELLHAANSDGSRSALAVERPFFSMDARWSAGVRVSSDTRVDSLWALGQVESSFGHQAREADLWGGWSSGLRGSSTLRWSAGFTLRDDTFEPPPGREAGGPSIPLDRRLAYPWLGVERVRDGFVTLTDLDKIHRTEDVNLGATWRARLGFAAPAFGSDRSEAVLETAASAGRPLGAGRLLLFDASASGRAGAGGARNVLAESGARLVVPDLKRGNLVVWLRGAFARALDPEQRLLLGGDSGLRGYPLRYAYGERTFVAGVEQRLYGERQIFHLFRAGAAAFAEVGRAWGGDAPASRLGLLRDIGIGLRLGSSRSSHGAMVHVDLAYPLDAPGDRRRPQLLISTGDTF